MRLCQLFTMLIFWLYRSVLTLIIGFHFSTVGHVISKLSDRDPSTQFSIDEPDIGEPIQQLDAVLQEKSQVAVFPLDQDEDTSWLALPAQDSFSVSFAASDTTQESTDSTPPCADEGSKEASGPTMCRSPAPTRKLPKKPECPDDLRLFCCPRHNRGKNPSLCFLCGSSRSISLGRHVVLIQCSLILKQGVTDGMTYQPLARWATYIVVSTWG